MDIMKKTLKTKFLLVSNPKQLFKKVRLIRKWIMLMLKHSDWIRVQTMKKRIFRISPLMEQTNQLVTLLMKQP